MKRLFLAAGLTLFPLATLAQATPAPATPVAEPVAPVANAAPSRAPVGVARVRVMEAFLDLRTGPGRGYPITQVAERNEWVVIELRHTDWFKVRTARGQAGWVSRAQMAVFLLKVVVIVRKAGEPKHLDQGTYTLDQGREVRGEERD